MREQGIDALVLLGNTNVVYATGAIWPLADSGRANFEQPVAVVLADDEWPHLFSPVRDDDRLGLELPADHLHGPVYLDFDEGVQRSRRSSPDLVPDGAVIAIDEWTHALRRERIAPVRGRRAGRRRAGDQPGQGDQDARRAVLHARGAAHHRAGHRRGAGARRAGRPPDRPHGDVPAHGLRRRRRRQRPRPDLAGDARPRMADGPWTTTGDLACPLLSTERELAEGDVLWVDTGISYGGFHSDFGRTWIVGREPDARQRAQFERWRAIMDAVLDVTRAGATAADLTAAAIGAAGGVKPWMPHFYLGHGLGIDSAEMPYVGSDIGEAFDAVARPRAPGWCSCSSRSCGTTAPPATAPRRCCSSPRTAGSP